MLKKKVLSALFVLIPCLLTTGVGYFYQLGQGELIRNAVSLAICLSAMILFWNKESDTDSLDYNNSAHFGRFIGFYFTGFLFSLLLPVIPFSVWPIIPFALALSLFGNAFLGLFAYGTILMNGILLSGASANVFFLYFVSGTVAICVFHKIDEDFHVMVPTIIMLLFCFLSETAFGVLFINERLSMALFIFPVLNLFLTTLFTICILKYFSSAIIHTFRNKYQEMMDPEFDLLADMKENYNRDYMLALHTAYFAERIAGAIHADVFIAKACAYYHRLGKIYKEKYPELEKESDIAKRLCEEYAFPAEITARINECVIRHYGTKEATLVLFCDAIISSVLYLLSKNPDQKPDYDYVIRLVFDKKGSVKNLEESEITLRDLQIMKDIFYKEKLYYDFLYRE